MESEAQKQARHRWNEANPSSTVRLPKDIYNQLKQIAKDMGIGYHGLLKQIVLKWLEDQLVKENDA